VFNQNIPPSPGLSACSVSRRYLKVVCKVSVQKIQEMPPKIRASVMGRSPPMPFNPYSGDVPILPKIMPWITKTPTAESFF